MVPEKVGLKGVQRDGTDYEMTIVLDLDLKHNATGSKDRTGLGFPIRPHFFRAIGTGFSPSLPSLQTTQQKTPQNVAFFVEPPGLEPGLCGTKRKFLIMGTKPVQIVLKTNVSSGIRSMPSVSITKKGHSTSDLSIKPSSHISSSPLS
jgi:hypothetical protein